MTIDLPVPHIRSVTIFMLLNENETFSNMYLLDNRDLPEIQETSSPVHSPLGRQVRSGDPYRTDPLLQVKLTVEPSR